MKRTPPVKGLASPTSLAYLPVKMRPELLAAARKKADQSGISVSQLTRLLLRLYIAESATANEMTASIHGMSYGESLPWAPMPITPADRRVTPKPRTRKAR